MIIEVTRNSGQLSRQRWRFHVSLGRGNADGLGDYLRPATSDLFVACDLIAALAEEPKP